MTDTPTPPRKRTGKKRVDPAVTAAKVKEDKENVVSLFGTAPLVEDPPDDPQGIRPGKGDRKRRRSSTISTAARFGEIQEKIDQGICTMEEFVATLTPEELVRGQLRAHDGTWKGRPPKWIPAEFYKACVRELLARGEQSWRESFLTSIKVFTDIAADPTIDPKDRLKAAQYVVERVAGKIPDKVEVAVADPWETLISGIVAEAEDDAIANATRVLNAGE